MDIQSFKKLPLNDIYTVAFYNLENLFDTKDDLNTLDDDFLPKGKKRWTEKRYEKKLMKLGTAISNVGYHRSKKAPVLVGVAEVENKRVLKDLVSTKNLKKHDFDVVHFDSPDERGMDVGLLFQKSYFEVETTKMYPLYLEDENGMRDYTRDVLLVSGKLNGELVHVLVNHWPSRRAGADSTQHKRIKAAQLVNRIIGEIHQIYRDAKIIIMGDFNDDPHSPSIKEHLMEPRLYNPMETLLSFTKGSLNFKGDWNIFDQIIFTHNFFKNEKDKHTFAHADVFDKKFLKVYEGRHEGNPFRTYAGKKYLGGYSDHFPVYIQLKK
ncbi:endonuclease [Spongiivirga sp. MCCC 1A20706]|uniref:endonuclease/exonuclease/phosphatase family protein n=1 Tax=Spongiivirga sp. MCCC 1A20706 TaxID=3160963 RepID=UPI0039778C62